LGDRRARSRQLRHSADPVERPNAAHDPRPPSIEIRESRQSRDARDGDRDVPRAGASPPDPAGGGLQGRRRPRDSSSSRRRRCRRNLGMVRITWRRRSRLGTPSGALDTFFPLAVSRRSSPRSLEPFNGRGTPSPKPRPAHRRAGSRAPGATARYGEGDRRLATLGLQRLGASCRRLPVTPVPSTAALCEHEVHVRVPDAYLCPVSTARSVERAPMPLGASSTHSSSSGTRTP